MPQILDSIVESEDQVLQSWGGAASWEKQVGVWRALPRKQLHVMCDEMHCCIVVDVEYFFMMRCAMR